MTHGMAGIPIDLKPPTSRPCTMSSGHSIPKAIALVTSLTVKTPKISCLWKTSTTTLIQSMKGTAMSLGQTIPASGRTGLSARSATKGTRTSSGPTPGVRQRRRLAATDPEIDPPRVRSAAMAL